MISTHVTIDIQKAHQIPALRHTHPRQFRSQLFGVMMRGQTPELAP